MIVVTVDGWRWTLHSIRQHLSPCKTHKISKQLGCSLVAKCLLDLIFSTVLPRLRIPQKKFHTSGCRSVWAVQDIGFDQLGSCLYSSDKVGWDRNFISSRPTSTLTETLSQKTQHNTTKPKPKLNQTSRKKDPKYSNYTGVKLVL